MKKVLYLLTIGLVMAGSAMAQSQLLPRVSFGIKGGANLSNFSTNGILSDDSRAGFQAGVWSRIALGSVHLQPELYYTQKEAKIMQMGNPYVNTVNFRSIDLPILFGYSWGGDAATGHIQTGPLVAFGLGDRQSKDSQLTTTGVRVGDQNYAWLVGAGVDVGRVSFDARYEYGLNKLQTTGGPSKVRLDLFSLAIAYRLFAL
jgi:hypothetical protein